MGEEVRGDMVERKEHPQTQTETQKPSKTQKPTRAPKQKQATKKRGKAEGEKGRKLGKAIEKQKEGLRVMMNFQIVM